jgi:hypothetical protein
MADSTFDSEEFVLYDRWGPVVPSRQGVPRGGFTGSDHFNVSNANRVYMPGETRVVDNLSAADDPINGAGVSGQSIFRYLRVGTQNDAEAIAVQHLCVHDTVNPWTVTNDPDGQLGGSGVDGAPAVAVALGAVTDDYWAWFWTGGVCPEMFVSALTTATYKTDGTITAGCEMRTVNLGVDFIGFGITAAVTDAIIGYATAADDGD